MRRLLDRYLNMRKYEKRHYNNLVLHRNSLIDSTTESLLELNSRDVKDDFIIGSSQSNSNTADAAFSDVKFFDFVLTDEAVNGLYFCDETGIVDNRTCVFQVLCIMDAVSLRINLES